MYKVVVVDDEATSLKHICTIIQNGCKDYQIVSTANNGAEALKQIRTLSPDLVITDVRMPVMDGIRLALQIRDELPDTLMLIVSGHDDFEYTKGAIRSGVSDYILKPVMPDDFIHLLEEIKEKLSKIYYRRRNEIIKRLSGAQWVDVKQIERFFLEKYYYGAIIRKNALPRRFGESTVFETFPLKGETMMTYGRDEMESLYICPAELPAYEFQRMILKRAHVDKAGTAYTTVVFIDKSFIISILDKKIQRLHYILDNRITVGYSQILHLNEEDSIIMDEEEKQYPSLETDAFEYLLKEKKYPEVIKHLKLWMKNWERKRYSQLVIENWIRQIFNLFEKHIPKFSLVQNEYLLADAFFHARNMKELSSSVCAIIEEYTSQPEVSSQKYDASELLRNITDYISHFLAEPLSVSTICAEFGISSATLSRLFRKYEKMPFNAYLTLVRMEHARKLMEDHADFFIKEIALLSGYTDQFYFSRVFRSVFGIAPSAYMDKQK